MTTDDDFHFPTWLCCVLLLVENHRRQLQTMPISLPLQLSVFSHWTTHHHDDDERRAALVHYKHMWIESHWMRAKMSEIFHIHSRMSPSNWYVELQPLSFFFLFCVSSLLSCISWAAREYSTWVIYIDEMSKRLPAHWTDPENPCNLSAKQLRAYLCSTASPVFSPQFFTFNEFSSSPLVSSDPLAENSKNFRRKRSFLM